MLCLNCIILKYLEYRQEYVVWKVRLSYGVRRFIGDFCHFFIRYVAVELRTSNVHSTLISNATYSPWLTDRPFNELLQIIAPYTLLDKMRLYELWQLANQVQHLQGHVIEVGCWRGGAGCLLAHRIAQDSSETTVFLCDTFCGIVKVNDHDSFYQGKELSNTSESIVACLANRIGAKNITILSGIFPEESGTAIEDNLFKFVHIDVDVYQSARDAFEWLLPKLVDGAIVVFDDYGFASTNGICKFVDELHGRSDIVIIRNLNGQAVIVKRA